MTDLVSQLNFLLAAGAVVSQLAIVVLIALLVRERSTHKISPILNLVGSYGVHLVFAISIVGTALSLFYSEVLGFVPCGLCWFGRIFLYSQVVLSGLALWKRDRGIADYLLSLSVVGAVISLYHHYLQMGGSVLVECPTAGAGVDCAKRIIFEFGYVTFPLISFTSFFLIAVVMYVVRLRK